MSKLDELFGQLSREELLEIAQSAASHARNAREEGIISGPGGHGSPRDPLVRLLAAQALRDLREREKLSYREIAAMFNSSHSRIHQLDQELNELKPERSVDEVRETQTA